MEGILDELRRVCAAVAGRARHVRIDHDSIPAYAGVLPLPGTAVESDSAPGDTEEELAAFWITLDAINFGSGWFPTLRKRPGRSGYFTISAGLRERFATHGPWSAQQLMSIDTAEIASTLGQDPGHELIGLFAASLNDLGRHIATGHDGSFSSVLGTSAVALVETLSAWNSFADVSTYEELTVPFLKRAQITAADLARAGVLDAPDLDRLTMFADNLVPHVLRIDGLLHYEPELLARIERGELIDHDSPEEVEIRACALHAVELIVAHLPGVAAADVDQLLWNQGQQARYKAHPRHRCRCTAY